MARYSIEELLELAKNPPRDLYNVYAWHDHSPAIRVMEAATINGASACVDAYLNRGLEWDAYMVNIYDDPGYLKEIYPEYFEERE